MDKVAPVDTGMYRRNGAVTSMGTCFLGHARMYRTILWSAPVVGELP